MTLPNSSTAALADSAITPLKLPVIGYYTNRLQHFSCGMPISTDRHASYRFHMHIFVKQLHLIYNNCLHISKSLSCGLSKFYPNLNLKQYPDKNKYPINHIDYIWPVCNELALANLVKIFCPSELGTDTAVGYLRKGSKAVLDLGRSSPERSTST